jgi:putative ABC transport system permease protein
MSSPAPIRLLPLLWRKVTWRHWRLAPVQSGLLVGILALGIAVFFAIRLANRAAVASFQNFTDLLTAESDGLISPPAGLLPESVLPELRAALGAEPVQLVAVLETTAARPRTREDEAIGTRETFQLLGVDLVAVQNLASQRRADRTWFSQGQPTAAAAEQPSRSSANRDLATSQFWQTFRDPRAVFISEALARRDGLAAGEELRLVLNERIVALRIAGVIPADPSRPQAPAHLLVMDLPNLQALTENFAKLSRVEFVLEDGPRRSERWESLKARLNTLANAAPDGASRWLVSTPTDRRASGEVMTRAFRLNLTILSLLALLVGLYLVFQALDGAVVRRREEIAILRSLGVTPREIQRAWLGEAALLGLAGGGVGLLLGWLGAQGAVRFVGRTVNALYYSSSADAAELRADEALLALVLAVAASVLAGWLPAKAAADTPPAQALGRGATTNFAGPRLLRRTGLALALLLAGALLTFLPPLRLAGGARLSLAAYATALAWVFGAGILGGSALKTFSRGFAHMRWATAPVTFRLALSHLREPSGRHRLAVAGLVCAIAMTAGMAILVGSFDTTMRGWITRTFQADLYLSSDGAQSASTENRISPATWRQVVAHPAVA